MEIFNAGSCAENEIGAVQGCFEAGGDIQNLPQTFVMAAARYLALVLRGMAEPLLPRCVILLIMKIFSLTFCRRAHAYVAYEIGDRRDRPRALQLVSTLPQANRDTLQCIINTCVDLGKRGASQRTMAQSLCVFVTACSPLQTNFNKHSQYDELCRAEGILQPFEPDEALAPWFLEVLFREGEMEIPFVPPVS